MGLFRISRGWQFEVCICAEPSVSPQSARAGEHFYRGEEEVGRAPTESMGFHCLCPCQERRGVSLLPVGGCCCCNLIYQSYQRLSTGDHMGLLESTVGGDSFPLSDRTLFRAPVILSEDLLSSFGECYLHMFPLFVRANTASLCG